MYLPPSLKITRDKKEENVIFNLAKQYLTKEDRSPGIHASGILDPRQEFFKITMPKDLTSREVWFFVIGKILHAMILAMMDKKDVSLLKTDEGSQFSKELGITWSPDAVKGPRGIVRELKTTRSLYAPTSEAHAKKDLQMYIEQDLVYMAASNTYEAKVWVLYINLKNKVTRRTDPAMRCYKFEISPRDLNTAKKEVIATRELIQIAVKRNNPSKLPLCRDWKCGAENCKWFEDCRPEGRYGLPKNKWTA